MDDLRAVVHWKSQRIGRRIERNDEKFISAVTGFALTTTDERARLYSLTLIHGVQIPTASVILHMFHTEPYPIIDVRALWSLSCEPKRPYSFDIWQKYVEYCRERQAETELPMREIDRALWQYSKENQ